MTTLTSISLMEKLNNLTECSVCAQTYSDPRVLPCIHTYCLNCIKRFSENKVPGDCVACPLCRKEFIVPECGIDRLPKNFFIEQVIGVTQTPGIHCGKCRDANIRKYAASDGMECQQKFCEASVGVHRDFNLINWGHILVEIGDNGRVSETVGKAVTQHCDKHVNEALKLYCFKCNEVICVMCFATWHQSHECSDIGKVSEDFRTQMIGDIQNLSKIAKCCHDMVKEQERKRDDFNNVVIGIETKIFDMAERAKKMIDAEKLKLMQELATYTTERLKEIQHVIEIIEQHGQFADSLAKYTEELRNKGTASTVAQQMRALHDRSDELIMKLDHIQFETNQLGSVAVSFDAAKVPVEVTEKLIGTISWQRVHEVRASTASSTPSLKHVINNDDDRHCVVDVTSLDSRLFVLRHPSRQQIQVYNTKFFNQQQTLQVKCLSDDTSASGLTSCATNNCLYVSDWLEDAVYKVELSRNNKTSSWHVGSDPRGLSINSACNLLVVCREINKIQEYNTTNGSLVREINLESNNTLLCPLHAIQLTSDRFVVCCWDMIHERNDVVEVDSNGRVFFSYRNQLKSTTRHDFNLPRRLLVDKNKEIILVADMNNNRIVILNRSFKCCAHELSVMSADGGLQRPSCLYFSVSQNQLFVGERDGYRRVLVFDNVI